MPSKEQYGNKNINQIIECMEIYGPLDGSQQGNRRFANLLINKVAKYSGSTKEDATNAICTLIHAVKQQGGFHSNNLTTVKYLFYNAQKMSNEIKSKLSSITFIS